ncbi:hypothetical protein [Cognaticolwellia beringensis]|uniref:Uncharacterized protein n=1 Tax=Cognaticolwellia beringensis TaxID=1967665 RepID=A0A222GBR2_9GAMM|nr:hypothetical protein [Cognaticolwellia beringensis]ASP48794.1 hypothetical protein B5D82_14080 [Cognaticolwellia beringensis]
MGISNKLDLFIFLLIVIPILIDLIKPLKRKLRTMFNKGHFSAINASLGAGLIFVHDFSDPYISFTLLMLGFILFFVTYSVSLASIKSLSIDKY